MFIINYCKINFVSISSFKIFGSTLDKPFKELYELKGEDKTVSLDQLDQQTWN